MSGVNTGDAACLGPQPMKSGRRHREQATDAEVRVILKLPKSRWEHGELTLLGAMPCTQYPSGT